MCFYSLFSLSFTQRMCPRKRWNTSVTTETFWQDDNDDSSSCFCASHYSRLAAVVLPMQSLVASQNRIRCRRCRRTIVCIEKKSLKHCEERTMKSDWLGKKEARRLAPCTINRKGQLIWINIARVIYQGDDSVSKAKAGTHVIASLSICFPAKVKENEKASLKA